MGPHCTLNKTVSVRSPSKFPNLQTRSLRSYFSAMDDQGASKNSHGGAVANNNNNGYVDTSKAERAVWLMKCPPIVSRSLRAPPSDPSRPVAKVVVSIDPLNSNDNDDSPPQFTMELAGTEAGNIPRCYAMDMSKDFIPMSVFSDTPQGKISVEGKILNKFDMKPHNQSLELYGKLCRERTNKYMVKSRQIQVIDNDSGAHMRPMPGMIILAPGPSDKKKTPARGTDMKRTRRDRGEMEEIVFKLFERQSNWSLRNLIQETDQPEQFLKDILKDLCVYNNKGTNQGTYELKPEYRKSGD